MTTKLKICITILLLLQISSCSSEVLSVVEMTRHGARAPISPPIEVEWTKKNQPGELTVVGKRQMYLLGRFMAGKYPGIFLEEFNSKKHVLLSTEYNRTIVSAISHSVGLFNAFGDDDLEFGPKNDRYKPPVDDFTFPDEPEFTTPLPKGLKLIPISSSSFGARELHLDEANACKKNFEVKKGPLDEIREKTAETDFFKENAKKVLEILNPPEKSLDFKAVYHLADFVVMDNLSSKAPLLPKETYPDLYRFLEAVYSIGVFSDFRVESVTKVSISPTLELILDIFSNISEGKETNPKFLLLSAHDSTLSSHLVNSKIVPDTDCLFKEFEKGSLKDTKCQFAPTVASNIVWELIKEKKEEKNAEEEFFIRFSYNGEDIDYCEIGATKCPFEKFKEVLKERTHPNFREYCGWDLDNKPIVSPSMKRGLGNSRWALLIGCFFILIVSVIVFVVVRSKRTVLENEKLDAIKREVSETFV